MWWSNRRLPGIRNICYKKETKLPSLSPYLSKHFLKRAFLSDTSSLSYPIYDMYPEVLENQPLTNPHPWSSTNNNRLWYLYTKTLTNSFQGAVYASKIGRLIDEATLLHERLHNMDVYLDHFCIQFRYMQYTLAKRNWNWAILSLHFIVSEF